MKYIIITFLSLSFMFSSNKAKANFEDLYNSYLESVFSFKFNYTRKVLFTLKNDYYKEIKSKLAFANYYLLMYETSGEEEKYYVLCKKEAHAVINLLSKNDKLTNEDVYHLVSAKSMLLRIQFMKKNYLKAAGDLKNITDYFEYALKNETDEKMKVIAGMYNYYIETAKEDYQIIYPLVMFYPKGNKKRGLEQIKESANIEDKGISIRAMLYLARIYHRDEKIFEKSKYYYNKLLNLYPNNLFWRYEYINVLKHFDKKELLETQKQILNQKVNESKHLTNEQNVFFLNI